MLRLTLTQTTNLKVCPRKTLVRVKNCNNEGVAEVDPAKMPGWYQLKIDADIVATGITPKIYCRHERK